MIKKYLKEWQNRCNREIYDMREFYASRPEYVGRSMVSLLEEFPGHLVDNLLDNIRIEVQTVDETLNFLIEDDVCVEAIAFQHNDLERQPDRKKIPLIEDMYPEELGELKNTLVWAGKDDRN